MVLLPNDEDVANSSKKRTQFKTRVHKPYPISYPTGAKNALQIMSLAAYASGTNKLTPVLFLTLSLRYNILSDLN